MNKQTQNKTVLEHMQRDGFITSWQAIQLYGITRLSGRIYDLRKEGYNIKSTSQVCRNKFGNTCNVARYELEEEKENENQE